jgi:dolichol-phosphate mannosyltransferase
MIKKKTSIILSTFNEEMAIEKTIKEIVSNVQDVEIVIVDDNSSDRTYEILKKLQNQNIKVFSRKKTRGLASAFLLGLIHSSGDVIGWIDSNMTQTAKLLPEMIKNLENNDIVLLSRFVKNGRDERNIIRKYSSYILNKITKLILRSNINDLSSGLFVMKRDVLLDVLPIACGHGEFMIEFLYKAEQKGNKIKELPYVHPVDEEGNSKSYPNLLKFSLLGFFYLIRILQTLIRR